MFRMGLPSHQASTEILLSAIAEFPDNSVACQDGLSFATALNTAHSIYFRSKAPAGECRNPAAGAHLQRVRAPSRAN